MSQPTTIIPARFPSTEAYAEWLQDQVAFLTGLIDDCAAAGEDDDAESLMADLDATCATLDALQAYA